MFNTFFWCIFFNKKDLSTFAGARLCNHITKNSNIKSNYRIHKRHYNHPIMPKNIQNIYNKHQFFCLYENISLINVTSFCNIFKFT